MEYTTQLSNMEHVLQLSKKDYTESRMEQIFSKANITGDRVMTIRFSDVATKQEAEKIFSSMIYHISDKLRINKKYTIKLENLPKSFTQDYKSTTFQRKIKGRKGGAFYAYLGENGFVTLRMKAPGTKELSYFGNMKNKAMFFPLDSDKVNIFRLDVSNGCNLQNIIKSIVMSAITQYKGTGEFKVDLWLKTKHIDGDWNYTQSNVYGVVYTCRKFTPNVSKISMTFDKTSINKIMTKSKSTVDELTAILTATNTPTVQPVDIIDGERILLFFSPHTDSITNYGMTILKHMNSWGITRQVVTDMLNAGQVIGKISDLTSVLESNINEIHAVTNDYTDENVDETPEKQYDLTDIALFEDAVTTLVKKEEKKAYANTTVSNENIIVEKKVDEQPTILRTETTKPEVEFTENKYPIYLGSKVVKEKDNRSISHESIDLIYDIDEMLKSVSDSDEDVLSLAIRMVESLNIPSKKAYLIRLLMEYARDNK